MGMSDGCIRIERERDGFCVYVTDPEIQKKNDARNKSSDCCAPWQDPQVEYNFDSKEQVLAFVEKAMDIALPKDEYSSTFDKLAKEAQGQ